MDGINISNIISSVYDNPFIGLAVAAASFFLIGYLIKKLKSIIVFLVVLAFIAGFYFYNKSNDSISIESIKNIKEVDLTEVKEKAEVITDESRNKFFEAFGDPRSSKNENP